MSDFLLTQVINYGAPLFGLILFLGAIGLPVGASVVLIAAGAFSQQGILEWLPTAFLGLLGAVIGDALRTYPNINDIVARRALSPDKAIS